LKRRREIRAWRGWGLGRKWRDLALLAFVIWGQMYDISAHLFLLLFKMIMEHADVHEDSAAA
jgi:hypothetical protein